MTIRDSVSIGNRSNGIVGTTNAGGTPIVMMIDNGASSHNAAGYGVIADGARTTIRLGGSSITGNPTGVGSTNGGVIQSFKTNQIKGNSVDGTPLLAVGRADGMEPRYQSWPWVQTIRRPRHQIPFLNYREYSRNGADHLLPLGLLGEGAHPWFGPFLRDG
ncbi:MAG: hypothetical protein JO163_14970 [Methylobacteriaceae bacterium]|nr:hypothetical protein [Methylobacteriaceae bacterium]